MFFVGTVEGNLAEFVKDGVIKPSFNTKLLDSLVDYIPTIIAAVIIYIIGCIINKIIIKLISKGLDKSRIDKTVHGFLKLLVRVILLCIILIIVLSILGIPMTSIITVIGSAGIAIGLALQDSLSNIAGGVIVLMGKSFLVGDYVSIDGTEGTVREINIFSTNIVSGDNKSIYIPNGTVSNAVVINYTHEKTRRVEHIMSISYDNDTKKAISVIKQVLSDNSKVLKTPEPFVKIKAFAASSIDIVVRAWVNSEDYWGVYFDLLEEIKDAFDENGIVIPYNQIDVHMKNE